MAEISLIKLISELKTECDIELKFDIATLYRFKINPYRPRNCPLQLH